jgi:hypothetical protein
MTVYISAPELPLVLACTDADVDMVVAEIGHWADAGLTNVFRSADDPSFVVNFGRVTAFTIATAPLEQDRDKAVFPIELGAHAHNHDHDHDHAHEH